MTPSEKRFRDVSGTGRSNEVVSSTPSRVWKWVRWVEKREDGLVHRDVIELLIMSRQIWRGFQEILFNEAPPQARKNATFDKWLTYNYFGAVGAGVGRQIELRDDRVSLGRLLHEVDADGVMRLPHGWLASGEAKRDLERLFADTKVVVDWVNKDFAHSDAKRDSFSASTTVGDIDRAVGRGLRHVRQVPCTPRREWDCRRCRDERMGGIPRAVVV